MDDSILFIVIFYGTIVVFLFFMIFILTYGDRISNWFRRMNIEFDYLLDKWFGGSISFFNVTIYGRNAMCWAVNIRTKKYGYVCFNLPIPMYGRINKFYYYLSPNGTPQASTYYKFGKDNEDKVLSPMRKECFGHNFNINLYRDELHHINDTGEYPARILREMVINSVLE
tara:strand:+ start:7116 stop:7625 length:510 start_codon:yes stop_codon:yes gene_type:complete